MESMPKTLKQRGNNRANYVKKTICVLKNIIITFQDWKELDELPPLHFHE